MRQIWFIVIAIAFLLATGCNYAVKTNDSVQKIEQTGASYTYVIVRLEFLQQVQTLCQDLYLRSSFATDELWKQQVAQCTFDNLSLLNIDLSQISTFNQAYCQPGSDLSGFTPQQQADIVAACAVINGGNP